MGEHIVSGRISRLFGIATLALVLAGCGGNTAVGDSNPTAAESVALPAITGSPPLSANVGDAYLFQPLASDPAGRTLTFQAEGLPAWATLDAITGVVSGTPADADVGETADISIAATTGTDSTALPAFKIKVSNASKSGSSSTAGIASPVISGAPSAQATAGSEWSFTPTASDPDSLTLTYSIVNKPQWASFSSTTGKLSGTPSLRQVATYANIRLLVTDGLHQVGLAAFTIQVVAPANGAPTLTGSPATSATVGVAYSFLPTAADPEKQMLGFSITNKPSWASFNTSTGMLSGTPTSANVGTTTGIAILVSDGVNQASLPAFTITVAASANHVPTISGTPANSASAGRAYAFAPTAADSDGDTLTFSITGKPSWATFSASTGELTGAPAVADQGSFANIVISVSDGKVSATLAAFSILVSASTSGSATLSWTPPTQNSDGSALTNLGGYRIYYGTDPNALASSIQLTNAGLTSYTVGNLAGGTYYFGIAAYTLDGVEGARSTIGSKTL